METLHLNSIQHSLFLLAFLIQFSSSPQFSSLGYDPQDKYFINCGSDTDVTANNRLYIGESKSGYPKTSFSSSNKENTLSSSVPSSTLYQTARVFQSPSWYEFSTVANGTYLVRLHFFAFASPTNLSTARFDVSVPEFWLLQNFNVRNTTNNNSALVKEFFVKITRNTFKITFRPLASSFAFVNAIELFELPLRLIADKVARFTFESDPSPAVSSYNDLLSRPSLGVSSYNGLLSRALETKHRLNVGGQKVTNDNLLRNWLPDDSYVINPGNAKNSSFNGTIVFTADDDSEGPNSNQYTAPNDVYQSAREINANSTDGNLNITWGNIPVDKNTDHLLRFHFCDIFNQQSRLTIFLLYIYDRYVINIVNEDPDISPVLPAPYYYDFVVSSDNSGLLKISVAPNTTVAKPNAFLNGLEIMKVIEPSSSVPLDDSDWKSKTRTTIAITVPVVAVILVLVIICFFFLFRRQSLATHTVSQYFQRKTNPRSSIKAWTGQDLVLHPSRIDLTTNRPTPRKQKVNKENYDDENEDEITIAESLQYNFDTIRVATSDFSDSNKLGQGGFGAVYRGKLSNEQMIAVKRLSMNSDQGDVEFKNEVLLVAKLQHRNLVRLLGFSLEGRERLLIYEFVPNKSLNYFIFDPTRKAQLNWEKRYNIIKGIARGLLYLHEDSRLRIIHRDVKASNILLDSEMNPKISDFGLARLFVIDQTQEITSRIVGTYGYMAPEYVTHGQFSVKSDVFSFGVLVLEIVSGQKNSTTIRHGEDVESLLTFAWRNWREGTITNIIDTSLNIISQNEMMRCIHIGLLCVQENLADRPTMATVALMLNSYLLTLSAPSKPAFVMDSRIGSLPDMQLWVDNSGAKRSIESVNKVSVTDPYPR